MQKKLFLLITSLVFLYSSSVLAKSTSCAYASKNEVEELFAKWNESLATGNPEKVEANYAREAVLIPTLSNKVSRTPQERMDYFSFFLQQKPKAYIDSRYVMLGCNMAIDNGIYHFWFDKNHSEAKARYTFVYQWNGKKWLIITHHSSKMPEAESK